jgi:hypothetical protein
MVLSYASAIELIHPYVVSGVILNSCLLQEYRDHSDRSKYCGKCNSGAKALSCCCKMPYSFSTTCICSPLYSGLLSTNRVFRQEVMKIMYGDD